jgi:hypothetical protein
LGEKYKKLYYDTLSNVNNLFMKNKTNYISTNNKPAGFHNGALRETILGKFETYTTNNILKIRSIRTHNEYINEKLSDNLSGFKSIEEVKKNLIRMYKNDKIDFYYFIKKLREHNIEIEHSEILDLLERDLLDNKIKISDIIMYNNDLDLDITSDEIFKFIGFDKSFDNLNDFLNYVLDNCKINRDGDEIILKYKNGKKIFFIQKNKIYMDYDIYLLIEYWFELHSEVKMNILVSKIFNEYLDNDKTYIVNTFFNDNKSK